MKVMMELELIKVMMELEVLKVVQVMKVMMKLEVMKMLNVIYLMIESEIIKDYSEGNDCYGSNNIIIAVKPFTLMNRSMKCIPTVLWSRNTLSMQKNR